jgi:integrase/recombinase XerD
MNKKIQYQPIQHRGQSRILIKFEFNKTWIDRLRKTTDARWSKTLKAWHIADTEENRIRCKIKLNKEVISKGSNSEKQTTPIIHTINEHVLPLVKQHLILKAYSQSTHKTYINEISIFLKTIGNNKAEDFTVIRIKDYLQYCFEKLKLSENTLHSRINALKFYYEQVLKKEKFFWEIPRPKKKLILPKLLNENELKRLFNSLANKKHKAMLFTAYSAGLRVSELAQLKIADIDSKRMQIFIENAKGKKDRYVNLSPILLDILRNYLSSYNPKPKKYLFESQQTFTAYPTRTIQAIFAEAKSKAGILKDVGVHSLRHSFATHLLDKGTDIKFIKDLLGHFDIKTTERYLHVSKQKLVNIISPLDDLMKNEQIDW